MANRDGLGDLALVIAKLNRELNKIPGKTMKGLVLFGLLIQRNAMLKTPVDTGNLINSFRVTQDYHNGDPVVAVANTAAYAPYDHEALNVTFKKPSAEPQFLQRAALESEQEGLRIVAREARV